jgi:hypothetical protein
MATARFSAQTWSRTCRNSMRSSRPCCACIMKPCSDSRLCRVSVSIRRNRSSRKSAPRRRRFPTAKHLASWVGACRGHDETAGDKTQSPRPERQSPNASTPQPIRARGGEDQGQHLRTAVPAVCGPPRPCPGHRRSRASTLSARVEDPARRRHVRGTRPGSSAKRGHSVEPRRCFANSGASATASNSPRRPRGTHCDRSLIFEPVSSTYPPPHSSFPSRSRPRRRTVKPTLRHQVVEPQ